MECFYAAADIDAAMFCQGSTEMCADNDAEWQAVSECVMNYCLGQCMQPASEECRTCMEGPDSECLEAVTACKEAVCG